MNASTLTVPVATASDRLLGRKALVTGSSKGIGRGIAIRLAGAEEGADVVINYNSDPRGAEEALAEVQALGRRGAIVRANLGTVGEVRDLVARSAEALGGLDVLVNNAGIEKHAPFWEVTENDFDAVLNVNLKGVFFAAQAFVQQCLAAGRPGKIINISSVHEELAFPNFAAYCASKGGVRMLTRTLAVELGPVGITINSIAPGAIETPINDQHQAPERSGETPVAGPPDSAGTPGQAERRRRPGGVPGVVRQRLRHRHDLPGRRRPDGVLPGAISRLGSRRRP